MNGQITGNRHAAVFLGALTVLCWAGYNVAAKAGIDAGMSPAALSFLRYLIPGVVALPLWALLRYRAYTAAVPFYRLVVLAILGGPIFGVIAVAGYQFAPLSHGLLFAPVAVFLTATLWGLALLNERISRRRSLGAVVMFGGLALLVGVEFGDLGHRWPFGIALFAMAGLMWGSFTVLLRHWRIPTLEGTAAVASLGAIIAAVVISPWAWASVRQTELDMLVMQIVMQGFVGGILSVVVLIAALQRLSAQVAAMLPTFTPAVALTIAWGTMGTRPEPSEILGATIIFAGFALAMRPSFPPPTLLERTSR